MDKRMSIESLLFVVMVLVTAAIICLGGDSSFASGSRPDTPDDVVVNQSGMKALVIRWKKVKGADGYEIQKARGNLGGYKDIASIKRTSYKDKTVKPGGSGTYRVRAYTIKNEETIYSPYSYSVSAKMCEKKDRRRNAERIRLKLGSGKSELVLKAGESIGGKSETILVTVEGPKRKGRKGRVKPLHGRVRWFSTDPSIIKADSRSKIEAGETPGSAYIYVRAHNGKKSNRIKVTVKGDA